MADVIDLSTWRTERRRRERQERVAAAVAREVIAALSADGDVLWLTEDGAPDALHDLVAEKLAGDPLFAGEIEITA